MVLHGIERYCMILHGIVWYCMALHGIEWYYKLLKSQRNNVPHAVSSKGGNMIIIYVLHRERGPMFYITAVVCYVRQCVCIGGGRGAASSNLKTSKRS